jgi:hypothetical protein
MPQSTLSPSNGIDAPMSWRQAPAEADIAAPAENGARPHTDTGLKYLVPFSKLKEQFRVVSVGGQLKVDMTYDELMQVTRKLLQAVPVDEAWYRKTYPDVAEAIDAGDYRTAKQHFIDFGYFEGRRPFEPEVDELWYLRNNPDVRSGVEDGSIKSPATHFIEHGYDEGRPPMQM